MREGEKISESKIKGVKLLVGALLLFQIGLFAYNSITKRAGEPNNAISVNKIESEFRLFKFDPNTVPKDSLVLLGLTDKQAETILNYRAKGGKFFKVEDFAKMYVVNEEFYSRVKDSIYIPDKKTDTIQGKRELVNTNVERKRDSNKKREQSLEQNTKSPFGFKDTLKRVATFNCNLNLADSAQLVKLYGIGPYYAKKILNYREKLGGSFVAPEQLMEIDGIDLDKFEGLKKRIFIDEADIKRFRIDTLSREFMERHPYIGAYAARGVILYIKTCRESGKNHIITPDELAENNIITSVSAARLNYYIEK